MKICWCMHSPDLWSNVADSCSSHHEDSIRKLNSDDNFYHPWSDRGLLEKILTIIQHMITLNCCMSSISFQIQSLIWTILTFLILLLLLGLIQIIVSCEKRLLKVKNVSYLIVSILIEVNSCWWQISSLRIMFDHPHNVAEKINNTFTTFVNMPFWVV